jgi:hypothetical protein
VFGQELGAGAFSTVTYAKQITAGLTQTEWPQYAVKRMAIETIKELGCVLCWLLFRVHCG